MFKSKTILCFLGVALTILLWGNSSAKAATVSTNAISESFLISSYDQGHTTYHTGKWTGYYSTEDLSYSYFYSNAISRGLVFTTSGSTLRGFVTNYTFHSSSSSYTRSISNGGTQDGYVRDIQYELYKLGYLTSISSVDGYFGRETQAAVMQFQFTNSLSSDGIVGYNTWYKLSSTGLRFGAGTPLIVAK